MRIPELRPVPAARSVRALLAVGLGLVIGLAASPAVAQPTGTVQIKGTRFVNGEQTRVKCGKTEGNLLDATTLGTRVFTLASTPDCSIFTDTPGDGGVLTFTGFEAMVTKKAIVKARYVFSGVETGGLADGGAEGLMKGKPGEPRASYLKEKGTITYSYVDEFTQDIVFVGKYIAKFP